MTRTLALPAALPLVLEGGLDLDTKISRLVYRNI
jgi:hypothetical protein